MAEYHYFKIKSLFHVYTTQVLIISEEDTITHITSSCSIEIIYNFLHLEGEEKNLQRRFFQRSRCNYKFIFRYQRWKCTLSFYRKMLLISLISWVSMPSADSVPFLVVEKATYEHSISLSTGVLVPVAKSLKTWGISEGSESHCLINWGIRPAAFAGSLQYFEKFPVTDNWHTYAYVHRQGPVFQRYSERLFIPPNPIGMRSIYKASKWITQCIRQALYKGYLAIQAASYGTISSEH